jgi:hypothetical protein
MLEPGVQITTLKCGIVMPVILYQTYMASGTFFVLQFRL